MQHRRLKKPLKKPQSARATAKTRLGVVSGFQAELRQVAALPDLGAGASLKIAPELGFRDYLVVVPDFEKEGNYCRAGLG